MHENITFNIYFLMEIIFSLNLLMLHVPHLHQDLQLSFNLDKDIKSQYQEMLVSQSDRETVACTSVRPIAY